MWVVISLSHCPSRCGAARGVRPDVHDYMSNRSRNQHVVYAY